MSVRACVQACTMLAAACGQLQHNPLTIQSSYSLLHISLAKQNVQLVSIKFNSTSLHKLSRFENNPTKGQWRYSCHVPLRWGKHKAVAALCRGKGGPCPPVATNEVRVMQCEVFHWRDRCAPGQRGGRGQQSGGEGGLRSGAI